MKQLILNIATILIVCASASAQPDTLWTKTYGGWYADSGFCVQQTSDGGFIIAGTTSSYGAGWSDVYLIKTDAEGNQQWYRTFGGSYYDGGHSVQQTSDGGFIITGYIEVQMAGYLDYVVCLIKTNINGYQQWCNYFGSQAEWNIELGESVQQTLDGGFIIAGVTSLWFAGYNVYLIKTYSSGTQQWSPTFGGNADDYGKCVQQTTDGGYIVAGSTSSYGAGSADVYLIKTDAGGNQQWYRTFGRSSNDYGESVQQTTDGGYIIAGSTNSFGAGGSDVYLIKTDAYGNQEWYQTFGGSSNDYGKSVQQTSDGGFIIAGSTESYGAGGSDVYLIKTDASGDTAWTKTVGGSYNDYGESVQQTLDEGYIIAGYTGSFGYGCQVYLIRLESETLPAATLNINTSGDDVILTWDTIAGAAEYRIFYQDNPYFYPSGIPQAIIYPPETVWTDVGGLSQGKRFYRLIWSNQ